MDPYMPSGKLTLTALACLINSAVRYTCFFFLASLISIDLFLIDFPGNSIQLPLAVFKKHTNALVFFEWS